MAFAMSGKEAKYAISVIVVELRSSTYLGLLSLKLNSQVSFIAHIPNVKFSGTIKSALGSTAFIGTANEPSCQKDMT